MNAHAAVQPELTPADRLGLTLCLAAIFHAIIVLGVSFVVEDKTAPRYETMEIVLVHQSSKTEEKASVLAQADMQGGGEVSEKVTPATPMPVALPEESASTPETSESQTLPEPVIDPAPPVIDTPPVTEPVADTEPPEPVAGEKPAAPEEPPISATSLLTQSLKMAALSTEIKHKMEARTQRPKRAFISANTRKYKYAAYMEAWRAKVERVGNLNYPEEARKQKLSGQLILDVALNPDGSINDITIRRSSGHKILDDAAIRIVELASPFAPFPSGIRDEADILHITRTWQFLNNRGFR